MYNFLATKQTDLNMILEFFISFHFASGLFIICWVSQLADCILFLGFWLFLNVFSCYKFSFYLFVSLALKDSSLEVDNRANNGQDKSQEKS